MIRNLTQVSLSFWYALAVLASTLPSVVRAQESSPSEVPTVEASETPQEEPTPEESPTPEVTATAEPTDPPVETETPESTTTPESTETPQSTPTPDDTPTPPATPTPDVKCSVSVKSVKLRIDGEWAQQVYASHHFYPRAPITPYDTFNIIVSAELKCVDRSHNDQPVPPDPSELKAFTTLRLGTSGSSDAETNLLAGPSILSLLYPHDWDSTSGTLPIQGTYKVRAGASYSWVLPYYLLEALIDKKEYFAKVQFFYKNEEFSGSSQTYKIGTCIHIDGADNATLKYAFKRASTAFRIPDLLSATNSAMDGLHSTYPFPFLRRENAPGTYIGSYVELDRAGASDYSHSCGASMKLTTIVGEYPYLGAEVCGDAFPGGSTARISRGDVCPSPKGFLHEMGHALGVLDDAYVDLRQKERAFFNLMNRGKRNCRPDFTKYSPYCPECTDSLTRENKLKGCGASMTNYYQPGSDTVMESPSASRQYATAECMMMASELKGESAIAIGSDGGEAWKKYGNYCGAK